MALLHSYSFPLHEQKVKALAAPLFSNVSLSSEIMPRVRIVNRGNTSCVDAYLNPVIQNYLSTFLKGFAPETLKSTQILFMQSDGGLCDKDIFKGSRAIMSGPAGGYVGYALTTPYSFAQPLASALSVIGFDMGGTSTDVSRITRCPNEEPDFELIFESEIAGAGIYAPSLDIRTVAAGGGSRLTLSKSGMFKVGPESAGAHPGPLCYGKKGGLLAVTDANLVLGRILPQFFPRIFGDSEDEPLNREKSLAAFQALTQEVNEKREKGQ